MNRAGCQLGVTIDGCGAIPLDAQTGTATCTVTYATAGPHPIEAEFSGNASFTSSLSPTLTQVVNAPGERGPTGTRTTLTSSADPAVTGQLVIYTANVAPAPDGGTVR